MSNIFDSIKKFNDFVEFLKFFDDNIISQFHARGSTYNFHYNHFEIVDADSSYDAKIINLAEQAGEKWVVKIVVTDNSNSYDSYFVLLSEIYDWYKIKAKKEVLEEKFPKKLHEQTLGGLNKI